MNEMPKTAIEYFKAEKRKHTEPYQKFYDEAIAALKEEREFIRPIDAYALEEKLLSCRNVDRDTVRAMIADAPMVKAVSMKFGEWIPQVTEGKGITSYTCSRCGAEAVVKLVWCTCGARMT